MADSKKPTPKVGYKKPPKHSQFKPGQSGNPNGRPKGTKNRKSFEDLLREEADRLVYEAQKKVLDDCGLSQYGIKPKPRRPKQ